MVHAGSSMPERVGPATQMQNGFSTSHQEVHSSSSLDEELERMGWEVAMY